MVTKPFHLVWFTWTNPRDWEDPSMSAREWARPDSYLEAAKILDGRGGFDMIVFADTLDIHYTYKNSPEVYLKRGLDGPAIEPISLIAYLAAHTKNLGFTATLNTSYYSPYYLARQMATLDNLTDGRAAWNIVTGAKESAALNLGIEEYLSHDGNYDKADEYVALCQKIWSAWDGGADGPAPAAIDFDGSFYHAHGASTAPAPRKTRPVIVQAGGSARGRQFAATHADVVISHQNTVDGMKDYIDDVKARARSVGRNPDDCKVVFTAKPFIGETAADAAALRQEALNGPFATAEVGLALWSKRIGVDLSPYDLDKPFTGFQIDGKAPAGTAAEGEAAKSKPGHSVGLYEQHYRKDAQPTLREVAIKEAMKESFVLQGTPAMIAEEMQDIMGTVGGDGFAIRGSLFPRNVLAFADLVVPELQSRGLVRKDYGHDGLRANLRAF